MAGLQFATFNSLVEMPFYTALFASKLDHDKLDDSARSVLGLYEPRGEKDPNVSSQMQILGGALTSKQCVGSAPPLRRRCCSLLANSFCL